MSADQAEEAEEWGRALTNCQRIAPSASVLTLPRTVATPCDSPAKYSVGNSGSSMSAIGLSASSSSNSSSLSDADDQSSPCAREGSTAISFGLLKYSSRENFLGEMNCVGVRHEMIEAVGTRSPGQGRSP